MANERFKRTPTSSGNRSTHTWSGWIKRNVLGDWTRLFSTAGQTLLQLTGSSPPDQIRYLDQTGSNYDLRSTSLLRDVGSWMHIVLSVDHTLSVPRDRVRIYVNGAELDNYSTDSTSNGSQNLQTYFNSITEHGLLGRETANAGENFKGEAFDIFWIDGQALTPDVFGFYKDGDGYMSSGSSQATDFRPGQWMPHSPTKIKKDVNRRGGFGVNGFYLPMNDSSNPGADFHCDPNSIITLKGEDLPQPRNGAPTTSDAYVSQLRQEVSALGFDGCIGVSNYSGLVVPDHSDLDLGTGDYTIEGFYYIRETNISTGYHALFDFRGTSGVNGTYPAIFKHPNGHIYLYLDSANRIDNVGIPISEWFHIALSRSSGTTKLFVDGVEKGSFSDTISYLCRELKIGHSATTSNPMNGFISNFRVVKGTSLYNSNFTKPTKPLENVTNTIVLCAQSATSPTAGSIAPTTITTYGSNVFATKNELTGSIVLAVPGIALENTNTELVTNGDFSNGTTGWTGLSGGSLSVEGNRLKITETTNALDAYAVNSTAITTVSGTRYTIKWTFHEGTNTTFTVRFGNSGNQQQEYLSNSSSQGQFSDPGTYSFDFEATGTQLNLSFIVNQASSYGYISNVSVKEAMPVRDYSADIKGSGSNKTLTAAGSAGIGYELGGYYGSAMGGLESSSDYFTVAQSSDFAFGSGDFTVEYWQYNTSYAGTPGHGIWDGTNNQRSWLMYNNSSSKPRYYTSIDGVASININSDETVPTDQWNHYCMERVGSTLFGYLNGVCHGSNSNLGTQSLFTPVDPLYIANWSNLAYSVRGNLQDFRIYKGVAKYKGSFDVPKPYTPVGIEAFRTTDDTCKNNFATWNAIDRGSLTLSDGNLSIENLSSYRATRATIGIPTTGKWYYEHRESTVRKSNVIGSVGIAMNNHTLDGNAFGTSFSGFYWGSAGLQIAINGTNAGTSWISSPGIGDGDILNIAYDADSRNIWFGINGTYYTVSGVTLNGNGNPTSGTNPTGTVDIEYSNDGIFPYCNAYNTISQTNFGQNPSFSGTTTAGTNTDSNGKGLFKYAPPTGFLALCEDNLPAPAIADPGKHFKTVLYHGDGNNGHSITGVGFQPDLVWLKERGPGSSSHQWHDSIRGAGKALISNVTNAESYSATYLYSLDSDGFTLGTSGGINASTDTYVAWCWKAGGAAVSNSDGDLTSQVSVNQDAGFSIVKFTAQTSGTGTVGHGLGKKPAFWIYKPHANTTNWYMYHQSLGASAWLNFTTSQASTGNAAAWGGVEPTSTVLTHGSGLANQGSCILYAWAEIEGYSKFGSYTGNGSTDGPFVYCGFKPAWVMIKAATELTGYTSYSSWGIKDSSRYPSNINNVPTLWANESYAEGKRGSGGSDTYDEHFDFLSNGFKIGSSSSYEVESNRNGVTYIFAAFAESPFQTANAK